MDSRSVAIHPLSDGWRLRTVQRRYAPAILPVEDALPARCPRGPIPVVTMPMSVPTIDRSACPRCADLRAHDGPKRALFDDLYASLADRSSRKLVDRLARVPLLCIDEMGYLNLRPEQSNIFFKLMEERYRRRASVITTNLDYDDWFNFLGNKPMVTALLSRLRHQCTTIRIDGPSLREPQG
jgi:hypothetical protein